MATRSRIAIRNADGTYTSIYCLWDGYPSHNGQILHDHYNTEAEVRALMALGNLFSLDVKIGEKHDFEARNPSCCTAYGRDRGAPGQEAENSADLDELKKLTQECGGEWLYVFTGHTWLCAKGGVSYFGSPASKAPEGLESISCWLNKETS